MEFVVLAELLRLLVQTLRDDLTLVQLLTVDALLRHLERNLQRHKLFFRSDHLFLVEIGKFLKGLFGSEFAVIEVVLGGFFIENAGDYFIDALIEFGELID